MLPESKSPLALAREAVKLAKKATPGPIEARDAGESTSMSGGPTIRITKLRDSSQRSSFAVDVAQCFGSLDDAKFHAHAANSYATVARAAIEYANLLKRALPFIKDLEDEGPEGETWKSDELIDLCARIDALTKGEQ